MPGSSRISGRLRVAASATAGVLLALESAVAEGNELEGYVLVTDAEGRPQYAAEADGRELSLAYDADGKLIATVDENGVVVDWEEILAEAALREE